MTTATKTLESKCAAQHWASFRQKSLGLAFQESATVIASPHKGDTVPVYQPPVLSRQNVGDPLTKKKKVSKNMLQVSMYNGPH